MACWIVTRDVIKRPTLNDRVSVALLSGVREQLQACADVDPVWQTFDPIWTDFGGGITRTREWREAVNRMGEIAVWKMAYV